MLNAHYDSHDAYLSALAREMRNEYLAITRRVGFADRRADLAMDRTMLYRDLDDAAFVKRVEFMSPRSMPASKAFRGPACDCTFVTATGKARTFTTYRSPLFAGALPGESRRAVD